MIDLLPPWAQKAKARRKLLIRLVFLQAVILIMLASFAFILNTSERNAWEEYYRLAETQFDPVYARTAEELQAVRDIFAYAEDFQLISPDFNPEWLDHIEAAMPENTTIVRVHYNGRQFQITSVTDDPYEIQTHSANLAEYFDNIRQGRITGNGDGSITYVINLILREE